MRIFISYARNDGREIAETLAHRLRAIGHEAFLDIHSLVGGSRWQKELDRHISSADIVIILVTPGSNESDYVYMEFKQAEQLGKLILPIRVDETPLPIHLRGTWQAVQLEGDNLDPVLLEIERVIRNLPRRSRKLLLPVLGIAGLTMGLIAIIVAIVLITNAGPSTSGPPAAVGEVASATPTSRPASSTPPPTATTTNTAPPTLTPTQPPTETPTPLATRTPAPTVTPSPQAAFAQATVEAFISGTTFDPPEDVLYVEACDQAPVPTYDTGLCIYPAWGGRPRQILAESPLLPNGGQIAWDPQGERLIFSASESGDWFDDLFYVVNADGTGLTQLPVKIEGNLHWPSWSPDGEWLAVNFCDQGIMRPDGSEVIPLWLNNGRGCANQAQWSPDSQWLAVWLWVGTDFDHPTSHELWVFARDGSSRRLIYSQPYEEHRCMDVLVAFSPDGEMIAFHDQEAQECNVTYLIHASGSGLPQVIPEVPVWWTSRAYPQWGGVNQEPPE